MTCCVCGDESDDEFGLCKRGWEPEWIADICTECAWVIAGFEMSRSQVQDERWQRRQEQEAAATSARATRAYEEGSKRITASKDEVARVLRCIEGT